MDYSDNYLREVLPPELPPLEYVPVEVVREINGSGDVAGPDRGDLVMRSTFWTYAIFSELFLGNYRLPEDRLKRSSIGPSTAWFLGWPGAWTMLSVGLFDYKRERPGFGLAFNLPQALEPAFVIYEQIELPRLRTKLPVAMRGVTTNLHSAPNPIKATSACWARCNKTNQWGIVTAGHAIGSVSGVSITLDNGQFGISHRCYWQPIDAAFVLTPDPTSSPSLLPIVNFPAAGLSVAVESKSGAQSRTVASACNSLGFYRTRQFPVNFFLDNPCAPGDSGALVRAVTGKACGIYLGEQPSADTGGNSGLALNFAQAMFALETTAYR